MKIKNIKCTFNLKNISLFNWPVSSGSSYLITKDFCDGIEKQLSGDIMERITHNKLYLFQKIFQRKEI